MSFSYFFSFQAENLQDQHLVGVIIKIVRSFFCLVLVPTRTLIDNSFFSFAKHRSSFAAARAKLAQNLDRDIGLGCAPFHIFWPHYHNIAGSGGNLGIVILCIVSSKLVIARLSLCFLHEKQNASFSDERFALAWMFKSLSISAIVFQRTGDVVASTNSDNSGNPKVSRYRTGGTKVRPEVRGQNQTQRLN